MNVIRISQDVKQEKIINPQDIMNDEKIFQIQNWKIVDVNNDFEAKHFVSIPYNIKKEIKEKGFYAYNWIWAEDVKHSLERDYLKYLAWIQKIFFFIILALLFVTYIFIGIKTFPLEMLFGIFIVLVIISNIWIIVNLIFSSFQRFKIFSKNVFIVMTDTHIYFNWHIRKYNELREEDEYFFKKISLIFEEPLFEKSNLKTSKQKFMNKIFWGSSSKVNSLIVENLKTKWIYLIILFSVFYFIWLILAFSLYVISTLVVWVLGIIVSRMSKKILIASWHEITIITSLFEDIETNSKKLVEEKKNLIFLLEEAKNNEWKEWLSTKIDSSIENVNSYALNAINSNLSLKDSISKSRYFEMFNSSKYNEWSKGQLLNPLTWIVELLETNIVSLNKQNDRILVEMENVSDKHKLWQLELTKKRVEMKIKELNNGLNTMKDYISKLK